ncbi:hypothetical protein GGF31_000005 [Allomyces arbusculus]|nr:hypothetical protein GGF31_000005 [Allomyces arbusculus]
MTRSWSATPFRSFATTSTTVAAIRTRFTGTARNNPCFWNHNALKFATIRPRTADATRSFQRGYQVYGVPQRSLIDRIPQATVYGILGANTVIFGMWQYAREDLRQNRNPEWIMWMNKHFLLNWNNAMSRPWTLITCNFSHADLGHFLVNSLVLYSFGTTMAEVLGPRRFMVLYSAAALGTSAASLAYHKYQERQRQRMYGYAAHRLAPLPRGSLGASGCVMGTSAVYACLFPHSMIYLFGIVPIPAAMAVAGFAAYDFYRAWNGSGGNTDVSGHLGGGIAGLAFWAMALRRRRFRPW